MTSSTLQLALRAFRLLSWLSLHATILVFQSPASAEEPHSQPHVQLSDAVQLTRGVTCLEAHRLRAEVNTWLAGQEVDPRVSVHVQGSEDDPRSVRVHIRSADGSSSSRSFAPGPARCADLTRAVGLAVALALKRLDAGPREDQLARPLARSTAVWFVEARALLARGAGLPGAAGGDLNLSFALARSLRLSVGALGVWSESTTFGPAQQYSARVLAGQLALCGVLPLAPRLLADGCATLSAGRYYAQGSDFERDLGTRLRWLPAGAALQLRWLLSRRVGLTFGGAFWLLLQPLLLVGTDQNGQRIHSHELSRSGGSLSFGLFALLGKDKPSAD